MLFTGITSGLEWKEIQTSFNASFFSFSTNDIGWAIGGETDRTVFTTADGGKTWDQLPFKLDAPNYKAQWTPVFFYGAASRWVLHNDSLHHSTNGGAFWKSYLLKEKGFKSVNFLSETHGVANDDTSMYWTIDCGMEWQKAKMDSTNKLTILSTHFIDSMNGWIAGWSYSHWDAGTVLHTSDGGSTWKTVILSNLFNSIYCTDSLHCFAVGLNPIDRSGVITMSTDGCKTTKDIKFAPYLDKIVFLNLQTGIVIGDGLVWETSDSGNTWKKILNIERALSIGRSTNALFISAMGKMYKCELATNSLVNQSQMYIYRSRSVPSDSRQIVVNNNPILSFIPRSSFDLLGKAGARIRGYCPGCYLRKEKQSLYP
jgi:photosystem II stability/assembly factor-like uncharacterized protein